MPVLICMIHHSHIHLHLYSFFSMTKNKASPQLSSSSSSPCSDLSLSSGTMPTTKKTLDQVWTAISLSSLHPCSGKGDPTMRNEPSDGSTVLSLSTAGSSQHYQSQGNGGICSDYMSEFSSFYKKRGLEYDGDNHKHKRMIKNRESAARSRARKQAYTNELEIEAKRLTEENAGLRKQLKKCCPPAPTEVPKKQKLLRALSAPL